MAPRSRASLAGRRETQARGRRPDLECVLAGRILDGVGRTVRYLGLLVVAVATWFLVAGEAAWISRELSDRWFLPLAGAGAACLVVGVLVGLLEPTLRWMIRGRCVRCGGSTERGQAFCLDHLKESVNEAQDFARREGHRRVR